VRSGHQLLDVLDRDGVNPRAALWVYDDIYDRWTLWLVPSEDGPIDRFAFYVRMWEVFRAHPELGMTEGDVRAIESDHPAIVEFGRRYDLRGHASRSFVHTMLGDVFAAKGIILRMAMQAHSAAA
jgi:hypothetical protein